MPVQEIYAKFKGTIKLSQEAAPQSDWMGQASRNALASLNLGHQALRLGPATSPPSPLQPVDPAIEYAAGRSNVPPHEMPGVPTKIEPAPVEKPATGVARAPSEITSKGDLVGNPADKPQLSEEAIQARQGHYTPEVQAKIDKAHAAVAPPVPAPKPEVAAPPEPSAAVAPKAEPGVIDSAKGLAATNIASTAIKNVMAESKENPTGFGIMDWLKDNWGAVAVPAGMLLSMFGGRVGGILGGIAMGVGGANLYGRYKSLMSPEMQPTLQEAIGNKFDKNFMTQLHQTDPNKWQAAIDLQAAIHYGFATDVIKKIQEGGETAIKGFKMAPDAEARILEQYRAGTQVDTSQLPSMSTWGSTTKDYLGNAYDKASAGVKNYFNPQQAAQ